MVARAAAYLLGPGPGTSSSGDHAVPPPATTIGSAPMTTSISRSEIRRIIASYPRWYQNVHFGVMLDTVRSPLRSLVKDVLRIKSKDDTLISSLPDLTGRRVIDIGCNAGLYSIHASLRGASHVLGVDRSPLFIAQAKDVLDIYRRQGRSVGDVEFREVDDINNHLSLLDDRDVLMACAVLYHLGPLNRLKERIVASPIRQLILQGNTIRMKKLGEKNRPGVEGYEPENQTWGNVLSDVAGLTAFSESMGFEVERVAFPAHQYPIVIASRS
jgi:SAM-dependent methyltransferase